MAKKYSFLYFILVVLLFVFSNSVFSQEIKIFTLKDFDLKGAVKSCTVITNYGKEEFEFNKHGLLVKLVTRFNDTDYEKTYYKYTSEGELLEKRVENYRDGAFDKEISIANIYTLDTVSGKKITEKIVSYTKEFIDQYEYTYDSEGKLINVKRTNNTGIDNTQITYEDYKGEYTITYFLNEVIQKSIRTSKKSKKPFNTHVLTKEFMEGLPIKAQEQLYDVEEKIISETNFSFDEKIKQFVSNKITNYSYNDIGMLTEIKTIEGEKEVLKKNIYQYDNGETGNWIKKIITPDNTFTTREIEYYITEIIESKKP